MRKLSGILCASSMLSVAMPALAQSNAGDTSDALREIIVTAQKRSESIQSIPVAISALNSEMLAQRGISTTADLQFAVPSMQVGKLLGDTSITIRGVGLNQGSPGVAVHVDGAYQVRPSMGDLLQIDLERVEVLRGPQGTLYGRNANGGAVNFITKAPTDMVEGYALASYATYDEARLQGMINLPVTDKLRARAVVDWNKRGDGFIRNVVPGSPDVDKGETISGRLRVAVDLADNLTMDLSGTALHASGPSFYFTLYGKPSAGAISANPYLANVIVPTEARRTSANGPINSRRDFASGTATFVWEVGDGATLKAITSYARLTDKHVTDEDTVNVTAFPAYRDAHSNSFTQELNLAATLGSVDAVAGIFYLSDQSYRLLEYDFELGNGTLPPGSILHFETFRYDTRSYAAYADATWSMTDQIRLIGGIRFSRETQESTQANFVARGLNSVPQAPVFSCPLQTNDASWNSTTPRLGIQYQPSRDVNLYATASKGFKAGGFNPNACGSVFNPERLSALEGGIKTRLFDRTLTFNLSAFYYDYKDLQLSQVVALTSMITNAAAARVKGIEVETIWQPDDHWTINANSAFLSAKYKAFENLDALEPQLGRQELTGNHLSNAPGTSVNLGIAYRSDPMGWGRVTARIDGSYRSKTYFREFNGPLDSQPRYGLVNMALIWNSPHENYQIRLYATNLTNKAYLVRMNSAEAFGSRFVTWGAPRQIGAELQAKF